MRGYNALGSGSGLPGSGSGNRQARQQIEAILRRHDPDKLRALDANLAKYGYDRYLKMVRNHYSSTAAQSRVSGRSSNAVARSKCASTTSSGSSKTVQKVPETVQKRSKTVQKVGFSVTKPAPTHRAAAKSAQRQLTHPQPKAAVVQPCYKTPGSAVVLGGTSAADPRHAAVLHQRKLAAEKIQQRQHRNSARSLECKQKEEEFKAVVLARAARLESKEQEEAADRASKVPALREARAARAEETAIIAKQVASLIQVLSERVDRATFATVRKTLQGALTKARNFGFSQPKYLTLRLQNPTVAHRLVPHPEAIEVLHLAGFRPRSIIKTTTEEDRQAPQSTLTQHLDGEAEQDRQAMIDSTLVSIDTQPEIEALDKENVVNVTSENVLAITDHAGVAYRLDAVLSALLKAVEALDQSSAQKLSNGETTRSIDPNKESARNLDVQSSLRATVNEAQNESLNILLQQLGLESYESLFRMNGYDDVNLLTSCAADRQDWRELAEVTGMLPGHSLKLRKALEARRGVGQYEAAELRYKQDLEYETALEADRQNFGEHGVQTRSTGVELASLADLQAETVEMRRARLAASFETLSTSQADD